MALRRLEAERDQLKESVAELEQQVRVLENPRVTDEDWHKMALMYKERVAELETEARIQAQEARTQRATVREIYQLCSGAKGEPGDWNGALPVKKALATAKIEGLRMAIEVLKLVSHECEQAIAAIAKNK